MPRIPCYAGFDIGSQGIHCAVLSKDGKIVFTLPSRLHFGNPVLVFTQMLKDVQKRCKSIVSVSFTGSVGKLIADATKTLFVYDPLAIPLGAHHIAPDAKYVFHIGAKDPYYFELGSVRVREKTKVYGLDHSTGTKCGGGSGILAFKQYKRLYGAQFPVKLTDTEKLSDLKKKKAILRNITKLQRQADKIFDFAGRESRKSKSNLDVGGRCGVVIQSDMIHLQNSGEDLSDIVQGMNHRIARNYISDVIRTRSLKNERAIGTGGVLINQDIREVLEKELGCPIEVPKHYLAVGAIGVCLKAIERDDKRVVDLKKLGSLEKAQKRSIGYSDSLQHGLKHVKFYGKDNLPDVESFIDEGRTLNVLFGIDGGSTTSKIAVVDSKTKTLLFKVYIKTHGNPGKAGKELFRLTKEWADSHNIMLNIIGLGFTGSSASLYDLLFLDKSRKEFAQSDVVKDEITCHALGIKHFQKNTDTILEQGGQDAKFTVFDGDVVKFSKMNLSCMAGTGQTMENMGEMIGLNVIELNEAALKAKRVPVIDQTCGVFGEFGVSELIALGLPKEEIAASIIYQCAGGYINQFVANERLGSVISAQGGPMLGKAVLAAIAGLTGKEINAFPHREIIGAFGAALAVLKNVEELEKSAISYETKFRGWHIIDTEFHKEKKRCSEVFGSKSCGMRDCNLDVYHIGAAQVIANGMCPVGNPDSARTVQKPDYFSRYKRILDSHLKRFTGTTTQNAVTIGIPRSLTFLNEKGVFYTALYHKLGFSIVVCDESDDEVVDLGIRHCHTEFCFPMKITTGQARKLLDKADKILLVNAIQVRKGEKKLKFCPYVEGQGYHVKASLHLDENMILHPVIEFDDQGSVKAERINEDLERAFPGKKFSTRQITGAISFALQAQKGFLDEIHIEGKKILQDVEQKREYAYVAIGRGYTLLDQKACSRVEELFCKKGLNLIPAYFFDTSHLDIEKVAPNMYWNLGQKVIQDSVYVAQAKNLYPVRFTNFNCGPDQILQYIERDIFQRADKPWLLLQTDGHSSNKQFATRILAHDETVRQNLGKHKLLALDGFHVHQPEISTASRILGVAHMGDMSVVGAAALRGYGVRAEVMDTWTDEAKEFSKKLTISMACRPFDVQVGDSIAWLNGLKRRGIDPNAEAMILMPDASGPCRFGQYSRIIRRLLNENGYQDVPIISPKSNDGYATPVIPKNPIKIFVLVLKAIFCYDTIFNALLRIRPYEVRKGEADKVYGECLGMLVHSLETNRGRDLVQVMERCGKLFAKVKLRQERYPLVLMVGEIFVRHHSPINEDSIRRLESNNLEVYLSPVFEWVDYVRDQYRHELFRTGRLMKATQQQFIDSYVHLMKSRLYRPFTELLRGREGHRAFLIVQYTEKKHLFTKMISGESGITIGTVNYFAEGLLHATDGITISGIYHVAPFGCMHETLATSVCRNVIIQHRNEKSIIPFMDAVFGTTPNPNLDAEIAAFAEECYLKREMLNER